ncbi:MAG: hypothetical protein IJ454_03330, partial [Clostridia bacterium]|nr:hypothetical protein [Clostridia bacterium]
SSIEKAKIESEYKTLTAARAKYDELKKTAEDTAAADAVESLIAKLAGISDISELEKEIANAETAYAGLTDDQKKLVDNYSAIAEAKTALENKKVEADKTAADAVEAKIDEIGTVEYTDASKSKIDAARSAYASLTDSQKAYVEDGYLAKLEAAEADYDKLKKEADDKKAANEVKNLIANIGTVSVADSETEEKIKAAEDAYGKLTNDQKALIATEYATLTNARTTYEALKNAANQQNPQTEPGTQEQTGVQQ